MTFWCGSGSGSGSVDLLDPDADPDPAIFVFDLKMPTKNQFKKIFFCFYFLKVHMHYFQR